MPIYGRPRHRSKAALQRRPFHYFTAVMLPFFVQSKTRFTQALRRHCNAVKVPSFD
jgi:hypothetical protein